MLRKAQKEQEEIEERRRKNEERNVVLGWQKEENSRVRQTEAERIEAEKRMLVIELLNFQHKNNSHRKKTGNWKLKDRGN